MKKAAVLLVLLVAVMWADPNPRLEPLTGLPPHPADNPPTPAKIKLGKMLFFETMLSGGGRRSCGTCHKPELLFMDGLTRAWGLRDAELKVKTPGLLNVGWQRSFFSDGRVKRLEDQVKFPLKNHREMDMDPDAAAERVARDPLYQRAFETVFPGEPIRFELIAKAVAAFERTLVSYDSDLDRYLLGDATALTPAARRGMELFTGKARCISCHHGPLLTDHQLHYNGVPESTGNAKPGKKYKTPSLRDVARRFSFMHNGHILRVDHVIEHYARGGSAPAELRAEISPISLNQNEKRDLFQFLKALSGSRMSLVDVSEHDLDIFNVKAAPAPEGSSPKGPQDPSYINK